MTAPANGANGGGAVAKFAPTNRAKRAVDRAEISVHTHIAALLKIGPANGRFAMVPNKSRSCGMIHFVKDSNVKAVIDLLVARAEMGLKKYGRTTDSGYSRLEMLIHAREEALDLAVYLTELIYQEGGPSVPAA